MAQWEGKSKGNRLGYSIFVSILKKWGVKPAYLLLRFVVLYYCFFSINSNRILWYYFRQRMGFSVWKSLIGIYKNYHLLGQTIIDKIVVMADISTNITIDFTDHPQLEALVAGGKGGLLISAHIGNWEIAGHMLKRLNTRINVVMYDAEHQKIKEYLKEVTGGRNMNVIVIKDDISHIYEISEALKNNELVCIHADRFVEGNKTLQHTFLGKTAHFPAGPFALATTFKTPICFVFAAKISNTRYFFHGSEPMIYTHLPKKDQPAQMLADFVSKMETMARLYPEQWFNYFDFWASQPALATREGAKN
jgi:predicted LPLAT superfamily acyltransferase